MNKMKEVSNKKDIDYILNITEKDINKNFIIDNFGTFDSKPRFSPTDIITIPKGYYGSDKKKNKNEFKTTVGLWVFNKFFIEEDLFDVLGYINYTLDGGSIRKINEKLSYAILEGKITLKELKTFISKQEYIMRFVSVLSPNHSMKMLKTSKHIEKRKNQLLKQHKEELENGNEIISAQIEKELLDMASDYLKDDPSMDMYNSKSRGSFTNNFKNMFIMRGAIMNPDPTKGFDIATSNYIDGIKKEEYATMANSLVGGAYAKAKNTEVGGKMAKLYLGAFQHLTLDDKGSDCGTKKYIEVDLTKDNIGMYMYSFIIENGKLVELNSDNSDRYINKKVKMRFSSLCESKTGFCNACVGNLYYRLDIKNIGLTSTKIPNKVMTLSMKRFHNAQIEITDMDAMDAFNI